MSKEGFVFHLWPVNLKKMIRHLFHYESKHQPLLPTELFYSRLMRNIVAGIAILVLFLGIGIVCYHLTCGFGWLDSLLNASMILSGMGPVVPDPCEGGCESGACKIFASMFALVSGVVFITTIGIIIAPVAHRVFHRFHLEDEDPVNKSN